MIYGYLCEFPSTAALYSAAEKVRDAGFRKWDVHSPFPIHGMNEAMGLTSIVVSHDVAEATEIADFVY